MYLRFTYISCQCLAQEKVVEISYIWAAVKIKEQQDVNSYTWYLHAKRASSS